MSKIIPHVPKTTGGVNKPFVSLRMRLAALAYSLVARHPQYINLASKVQRIVHARYQDLLKRGVAITRHTQLRTQVSFYRAKQRTVAWTQRALHRSSQFSATLIAFSVALPFLLFIAGGDLKPSEVHLTAAQVIGAALALVLSLSIIPAQRAAEAFSPAILKLYARDRALLGAFVLLVITTMGSVLLGTNILGRSEPRWSIALQFILLGVSFDALRGFYSRVLELLVPQTAIDLVLRECKKYQTRTSKEVERLVQIFSKAGGESDQQAVSRALIYGASQLERGLQTWIAQLDEFGHKLIARRDTNAARDIISALAEIGRQYAETRKTSVILLPDFENLLAGGTSDIANVLNPIYESVRVLGEDAARTSNEPVTSHCVKIFSLMTRHAMSIVHSGSGGWKTIPLAYSPCFYLDLSVKTAIGANMGDALLVAVSSLQDILTNLPKDTDTTAIEATALESLFTVATSSYAKSGVWGFPAIKATLAASKWDIERNNYSHESIFQKVLEHLHFYAPLEVAMERTGKRLMQVFPPYDMGYRANIPFLLQVIAEKIEVDLERSWVDPFFEFLEASEEIHLHYRKLSETDFHNTLLRKWVIDSMIACIKIHLALFTQPPVGAEPYIDGIEKQMRWFIATIPSYYPASAKFDSHQAEEACGNLAKIGMSCLENDWLAESARDCGKAIAGIAVDCVAMKSDAYGLADIQEQLEVLTRAAEALGKKDLAAEFKAMIIKPANISAADWPRFLEARNTRIRQLDERLDKYRANRIGLPGDPVPQLHRILSKHKTTQNMSS